MPEGPEEWSLDGWSAPSLPGLILLSPLLSSPDLASSTVAWKKIYRAPIKVQIIPKSVGN